VLLAAADFVTASSAALAPAALIGVTTVDVLLLTFVSPDVLLTAAVLLIEPATVGRPTTVIVALAPGARSPRLAEITPPVVDTVPVLEVAETSVNPAGNASVKVAPVAAFVELVLVTVMV
jgi:hypothetical protein